MTYLLKARRGIKRLIFHHFGAHPPEGMNVPKIRDMHMKDRGWDDIGYHGVIMPDGEFSIGRDIQSVGAHTFGSNRQSIGIMFMAGIRPGHDFTKPNTQQLATARLIANEQIRYYGHGLEILGHRDASKRPTLCPGFDVPHWYETNEVRA